VRAVHHGARGAGLRVEHRDQRLVRRFVAGEEGDELRREHAVHVAGHRAEQTVRTEGGDPRRHRGAPGAQFDERALEPLEQ